MPIEKKEQVKVQNLLNKFTKIQQIRHKALEILLRVNKKTSEYKIMTLKKKLEDLSK